MLRQFSKLDIDLDESENYELPRPWIMEDSIKKVIPCGLQMRNEINWRLLSIRGNGDWEFGGEMGTVHVWSRKD